MSGSLFDPIVCRCVDVQADRKIVLVRKMKSFVSLLLLVLTLTLTSTHADDIWKSKTLQEVRAIRTQCFAQHPIPEELWGTVRQLDFPDEESVRQYIQCSVEKLGIFCTHEGYHADRVAKQYRMDFDPADALRWAEACVDKNEQNSPNDVWAYRGFKCLMDGKFGQRARQHLREKKEKEEREAAEAEEADEAEE